MTNDSKLDFRRMWQLPLAAVVLSAVITPAPAGAQARATFERVAVGGGGWFTGILFHPRSTAKDMVLYSRGDLAGIHRWAPERNGWINLEDGLPGESKFLRGCDGMAVDPSDASMNTVFAFFGEYDDNHNYWINDKDAARQGIWKSVDRGGHWTHILPVRTGSNEESRWCGEPLGVDPKSGGRVLLAGTRKNGLWISENANDPNPAAIKFRQLDPAADGQVPAGEPGRGIRGITFDPRPGPDNTVTVNGIPRTKNVYVALPKMGVWGSTDAGQTWAKITGGRSPNGEIYRMTVLTDGTLVAANSGGLYRYVDEGWNQIAPDGTAISAIATVPGSDAMIAFGGNAGGYHMAIYQIEDAKKASTTEGWKVAKFSEKTAVIKTDVPWTEWTALCGTDCATLNPANPKEIWTTDVYGCWMVRDTSASPIEVVSRLKDLEITVATCLDSPTSGDVKLWMGCGDVRGFKFKNLKEYPVKWLAEDGESDCTYGLTTSAKNAKFVGKISAGSPWGGFADPQYRFSTDGGETWTKGGMPKLTGNLGHGQLAIACEKSATPGAVMVTNEGIWYSDNAFIPATVWTKATAPGMGPNPSAWGIGTLQADRMNPAEFYMAITPDQGQMAVYVTTDGGKNWSAPDTQLKPGAGFDALPSGKRNPWRFTLGASPVTAGEIWLSAGNEGLYCSMDGAKNFKKINGVTEVRAVAVGLPRTAGGSAAVYLVGRVTDAAGKDVWGIYLSENSGKSWTRINDDSWQIPGGDWGIVMICDGQQFGRFFVGDGATGVHIGTLTK